MADKVIVALYNYKVVVMITLRAGRMEDYFLLHWRALQKDDKIGALNSHLSHKEPESFDADNGITISYSCRATPAKNKTQHLIVQPEEVKCKLNLQIHQLEEHWLRNTETRDLER